ncbi:MAG TPA: UbiA family prenyltransferase [archaeon]|nr:UbiA family prenyltransferase [archaeon]
MLGKLKAAVQLTRPAQWFKSLYLIIGAAPAMFLTPLSIVDIPLLIFASVINLIMMQGVIYTINDITDLESDRKHPTKSKRPLAAGKISVKAASMLAFAFLIGALYIGFILHPLIAVVDILLLANALAYNIKPLRLKDKKYIDIASAASNFPLRVLVGWLAFEPYNAARLSLNINIASTEIVSNGIQSLFFASSPQIIDLSIKFSTITLSAISIMLMTFFIAVFMLALKRSSEKNMNLDPKSRRAILDSYSKRELSVIARLAAVLALISFIMLALSIKPILLLSLPFAVYGMLKYYKMALQTSNAAEPETVFRKHRNLIALFVVFLLFAGLLLLI